MNSIYNSTKTYFFNHTPQQINLDQVASSNCVTTFGTSSSGTLKSTEVCFDDLFSEDSSGPIIIAASLGAFIIFLLLILLIKKNNSSLKTNIVSSRNKTEIKNQKQESDCIKLLERLKENEFPTLSISESFIKGNYIILKDLNGTILSESYIKGNYVIVTDLKGNVISEVKFKI